jgi:RND family efflux transporter MFP subunit
MKSLAPITRRRLILTSTLAATALLATLLPWQVVAQTTPPPAARGDAAAPSAPATGAAERFTAGTLPLSPYNDPVPASQSSFAATVYAPVVDIVAPVEGTLKEIAVKEGDQVKKGQLLFRFDAHDAEVALQLQQLAVERAKMQVAVPEGVASRSEIDQAKSHLQTEQILLDARAHDVTMASVFSPIDGVVSSIGLTPGQFIAKRTPLTHVVDLSSMMILFGIPSDQFEGIKVGQKVTFQTFFNRIKPPSSYSAQITYIAPMLENNSTLTAKATFTSKTDDLRPGMVGSATIGPK